MRKTSISIAVLLLIASVTFAAEQTWTGKIGDSSCGRKHQTTAEHGKAKMSDRDCTLACVEKGGKYVFVVGPKVYNIENQDYAGLKEHAGHTVKLTGELAGDSITVSQISM